MLSKGMMIVVIAALVALICFFLSWVTLTTPVGAISLSGLKLATGSTLSLGGVELGKADGFPLLFLMPLAMIGCLVLAYFAYRHQVKIRMAAYIAIGLAIVSLLVMVIKFAGGSALPTSLAFGAWLAILANVAIIGGGVLDLVKP
jgi:hypothetical protein